MAIHLVQRSIALDACQNVAAASDTIVLMGEGVAALVVSDDQQNRSDLLATELDIKERGLADRVPDNVTLISDAQLVALCAEHSPVMSWNQP